MKYVDVGLAARAMIELCKGTKVCADCKISFLCTEATPLDWDEESIPKVDELIAFYLEGGENIDRT